MLYHNHLYYQVAGEWISSRLLSLSRPSYNRPAPITKSGMLKVKSSVPVFTDTSFKQYTGKRLRPNSIWHYFAIYHRQGKTFYNLGGPQWIEGKVTLIK